VLIKTPGGGPPTAKKGETRAPPNSRQGRRGGGENTVVRVKLEKPLRRNGGGNRVTQKPWHLRNSGSEKKGAPLDPRKSSCRLGWRRVKSRAHAATSRKGSGCYKETTKKRLCSALGWPCKLKKEGDQRPDRVGNVKGTTLRIYIYQGEILKYHRRAAGRPREPNRNIGGRKKRKKIRGHLKRGNLPRVREFKMWCQLEKNPKRRMRKVSKKGNPL